MIVKTEPVKRYFSPLKAPLRTPILRLRESAIHGDTCFSLSTTLFQLVWGLISPVDAPSPPASSISIPDV